jgi:molybdenum cofactor cytidylyltransferase
LRFGEISVGEAAGAILAHSLTLPGSRPFKKGRLLSADDIAAIAEAGIRTIVAAQLDPDDLREDEAASRVAAALTGGNIEPAAAFTGRVNLFATAPGLLVFDRDRLDRLNLVDEALTLATLPPYAVVEPRRMIATVKVIPFAAPRAVVDTCAALAAEGGPLLRVAPFVPTDAELIQTRLPGLKESILDKTRDVTERRLAALGSRLVAESRCKHTTSELAPRLREVADRVGLVLVAGASAIVDRRDVIPAAIVAAGGRVEHFGMPVDPGNLMLVGAIGGTPVLGLPGCARSPKENGFDWVLQRLLARLPVGPEQIMRMGAGGLLAEIPSRPAPRADAATTAGAGAAAAAGPRAPRIAALLLAAGQSRRMGVVNKLLVEIDGVPMVRRVAEAMRRSQAAPLVVVLGHEADRVRAALAGLGGGVTIVENPDYAAGLSTSLRRGLAALPADVDGAVVCLGDMPRVAPRTIDRLLAAFNPAEGRAICVPTRNGKRGNPVLWARRFFPEMQEIAGDVGARHLIGAYPEAVAEIEMDEDDGVLIDIDTPEALADFTAREAAMAGSPSAAKVSA